MPFDHHVPFRSEESIATVARNLRVYAGIENAQRFDVPALIEQKLSSFLGSKGPVSTKPFDRLLKGKDIAWVSFQPRTINYHQPIWASARLGHPRHRLIFAHEIGHAILHDGGSKSFLRDPSKQLSFDQEGTSAEWQAITFSYHLLMPDFLIAIYDGAQSLATVAGVELVIAEDRLRRHETKQKRTASRYDDFCSLCGCLCDIENTNYCQACGDSIKI